MRLANAVACGFLLSLSLVAAVDRSKFRRCSDTGFCRKHRDKADPASSYSLDKSSMAFEDTHFDAAVAHSKGDGDLNLHIEFYESGTARIRITEKTERWQPTEVLLQKGMIPTKAEHLPPADARRPAALKTAPDTAEVFAYGAGSVLVVHRDPLKFDLYYDDVLQFSANSESFLHFEQKIVSSSGATADSAAALSEEDRHGGKEVLSYGEDGLAIYTDGTREEKRSMEDAKTTTDPASFKESFGGHADSRPNGPMSVGIDFVFPSASHVYGIPEHATNLALHSTKADNGASSHYKEPYRMYNLDVFEYELDEPMALYGHIPMMMGHGMVQPSSNGDAQPYTAGVFWFNPSETFIDVFESTASKGKKTHWVSESGNVDFFVFPGPTPAAVYEQYTALTGRQQLPPLFSLGYHQCRWNYRDQKDVASVESMFEELDYPVDVIWLDIEHTDGKRYFTWDKKAFPTPEEMQKSVSAHGRKMVTIVDPHIKRDDRFAVHKEATDLGLYIKNSEGKDFDGWCWPGSSSYLDFTNERVRQWWADRFSLSNYAGSTLDLFTWNDMNEPSVFNGPEVSMNKDAKNLDGIEHREWHNLYGMYMQNATSLGLTIRDPHGKTKHRPRPFVLSRAFWAGSQRFGAMWTGDNMANWESLKIASPMLLSIGLAGFSFAGADVGGFFGEPSAELFTRWYQAGAFTPFFRGHAHLDTKRREPWVYGEPYTTIMRQTAMIRYSLLPYWYTLFYQSYISGQPVMRAMFSEFPADEKTFTMDDQWMVGRSLLVKPVTDNGVTDATVYFPDAENGWYDFHTFAPVSMAGVKGGALTVSAPLDVIPVFLRGGSIVPRKMRLRRSASLMFYDPITLMVAPSATSGTAYGTYYMDDERTLDHEDTGMFAHREFSFAPTEPSRAKAGKSMTLKSAPVAGSSWMAGGDEQNVGNMMAPNKVERIIIMGQHSVGAPKSVTLIEQYPSGRGQWEDGTEKNVDFFFHKESGTLTVKKPNALVTTEWILLIDY